MLLSLFFGPAPQSIVEPHASFAKLPGAWRVAPVTETLVYKSPTASGPNCIGGSTTFRSGTSRTSRRRTLPRGGVALRVEAAFGPVLR